MKAYYFTLCKNLTNKRLDGHMKSVYAHNLEDASRKFGSDNGLEFSGVSEWETFRTNEVLFDDGRITYQVNAVGGFG